MSGTSICVILAVVLFGFHNMMLQKEHYAAAGLAGGIAAALAGYAVNLAGR